MSIWILSGAGDANNTNLLRLSLKVAYVRMDYNPVVKYVMLSNNVSGERKIQTMALKCKGDVNLEN
jgi:hypothetical protein